MYLLDVSFPYYYGTRRVGVACAELTVNIANRLLEKKDNKISKMSKRQGTHRGTMPKSVRGKGAPYLWSGRSLVPFAGLPLGAVFNHFSLCLFGSEFYDVCPRFCHCPKEKVLKHFRTRISEETTLRTFSANPALTD